MLWTGLRSRVSSDTNDIDPGFDSGSGLDETIDQEISREHDSESESGHVTCRPMSRRMEMLLQYAHSVYV